MSALVLSELSILIVFSGFDACRSTPFVHGVSLINWWSGILWKEAAASG